MFLRSVSGLSPDWTALYPRRRNPSYPPLREPHILMLYGGYFWAPCARSHGITPVRESWLAGAGESFLDGGGNEAVMQARTSANSYTRDFHVNKRFPERPSLVTCCGASPHNKTLGLLTGGIFRKMP
jgi:hypothetical protein